MLKDNPLVTPSRIFLAFWLALIAGMVAGKLVSFPLHLVLWFGALWLLILWSGQDAPVELLAAGLLGVSFGFWLWRATGGEAWIHGSLLAQISTTLTSWRDMVIGRIKLNLPEPAGSLLAGILFGNKQPLNKELTTMFQRVGLTHLIAVSGYNLTILTINIRLLFRSTLGRNVNWLSLLVILVFIVMTGAPASILRAGAMAGLVLLSGTVGRPGKPVNLLIMAAGILAVFEPKIIFDVGFLLSVAATYGLMRVTPLLEPALTKVIPFKTIAQILSETLAASLMTAPIIIAVFGRFSLVSPLSNILVLPLVPALMGLGIIGCLLALILPPAGGFIIFITWPLLAWIIFVSRTLASWSLASVDLTLPFWFIAAFMAVLFVGFEYLGRMQAKNLANSYNE